LEKLGHLFYFMFVEIRYFSMCAVTIGGESVANRAISHSRKWRKWGYGMFFHTRRWKPNMIHVIQWYASIGNFFHVFHLEMERDEEHVLGKVVLVQASESEEDILHLHWYKRVSKWTLHYTLTAEHEFTWLPPPLTWLVHFEHIDGPVDNGFPAVNI